jgi:SAM-dependent methyltransferase
MAHLDGIYESRFDERRQAGKMAVWAELSAFLSRWVDPSRPVIDVACDAGYFIRHVTATERWATDVRDVESLLPPTVRFVRADGLRLASRVPAEHFGTVFMSNYLEHLRDAHEVLEQLRVARSILAPGGRLIVLQPNVRLTGGSYWDFIDHHVPLTERSLTEAAELVGLRRVHVTTRFLPYSTKGRLPQHPLLVRWYLRLPILWRILGRQTLLVAERPAVTRSGK